LVVHPPLHGGKNKGLLGGCYEFQSEWEELVAFE